MASSSGLPAPHESYLEFDSQWTATLEQQLHELQAALESNMKEVDLATLVSGVQKHYQAYYGAKENAAKQNVLQMMSPSWQSPLENAFLWLGGWRPTMLFQLAYAEASHQLETQLTDLLEGIDTPTMAALSPEQLVKMNDLQMKTVVVEEGLTQRMTVLQQEIADDPLVTLAQVEAVGENEDRQGGELHTVEAFMNGKLKSLENLLVDADVLRYETLGEILKVLTVFQSAQYLVAAGYLQICIRRIGQYL